MKYVHAYAWMFATVLFLLAIQLLPGTLTGNVTRAADTTLLPTGGMQAMGLFIVLALAVGVGYARYRHFTRNHYHPE